MRFLVHTNLARYLVCTSSSCRRDWY